MRRLIRQRSGASGILVMIILVLTVMFGIIIGSTVFFAFSHATESAQSVSEAYYHTATVADANNTAHYFKLHALPDSGTPGWNLTLYGTTATVFYPASASNYTYIEANNTMKCNAGLYNYGMTKHNTSITISFNTGTYGAVHSVSTFAVTVFGLAAIIPLIIVGGIMLRSLGFMGGKEET